MTDSEIQKLTRLAYLRFYYRPEMIARQLRGIKSVAELKRTVQTAWTMVRQSDLGEDETGMEVIA
jgi:hypothetical protein